MAQFDSALAIQACFPAAGARPTSLPLYAGDVEAGQQRRQSISETKFAWSKLVQAYWFDWLLVAVLWLTLYILEHSGGHKREFSLTDTSIQHSFAEHERVPVPMLMFIAVVVPLFIMIPVSTIVSRNAWDVHNAIIGLFMSFTMAGVVTQIVKMMVGRPRPDLISRCLPAAGSVDHPVFGLSTVEICTNTNMAILNDGFKSFPSGHSSLSFAGMGFLACYLAGKMHLWDKHGHRTRAWFALTPLLWATMVALSRTMDNRHHWQDVLVGSLLGMVISFISYRTYYPPLAHPACHLPLLPASSSDANGGPVEGDEEFGTDLGTGTRVRLLSEETGVRPSAEEVAWRGVG